MYRRLTRGTGAGPRAGRGRRFPLAGGQATRPVRVVWFANLAVPLLLLALGLGAWAADEQSPIPVAGHYWGLTGLVTEGRTDTAAIQELVADLGVTHFRPVVRWSDIQPTGPHGWDWSETDRLFDGYRESGVCALVLLDSGSAEWATDIALLGADSEPTTDCPPHILPELDEPIRGDEPYYVFVREVVARYGDVAAGWLIDNEPSEAWSWAGDAYSYACMARLAAAAVHAADQDGLAVLGAIPAGTIGAMVIADRLDDPTQEEFIVSFASRMWGYSLTMDEIKRIFDAPQFRTWDRVNFFRQALAVLPEMDALAANVLASRARGELAEDVAWAYGDQMQAHGGGQRPLIYTEMNPYLSDELGLAQETTQLMIASLATGMVLGQAYHGFIDDTVERMKEPDCGLVTQSLRPKIGYHAFRTLISLLDGVVLAERLHLPATLTGYRFETDRGVTVHAIWASEEGEIDLRDLAGAGNAVLVDMVGDLLTVEMDRVPVSPSPTYVVVSPFGMVDVPWGHWAFDDIAACLDAGIVTGYPDGTYQAERTVTRDQMAVFIGRALVGADAEVPTGPAEASFADVPVSHWAFRHVEFLLAQAVVAGYADGLYRPDAAVDRAQMATFICRTLTGGADTPAPQGAPTFPDVTYENGWSWCHRYVEHLADLGIVTGYPDGLYHPEYPCSRDQMAAYIARAFCLAH